MFRKQSGQQPRKILLSYPCELDSKQQCCFKEGGLHKREKKQQASLQQSNNKLATAPRKTIVDLSNNSSTQLSSSIKSYDWGSTSSSSTSSAFQKVKVLGCSYQNRIETQGARHQSSMLPSSFSHYNNSNITRMVHVSLAKQFAEKCEYFMMQLQKVVKKYTVQFEEMTRRVNILEKSVEKIKFRMNNDSTCRNIAGIKGDIRLLQEINDLKVLSEKQKNHIEELHKSIQIKTSLIEKFQKENRFSQVEQREINNLVSRYERIEDKSNIKSLSPKNRNNIDKGNPEIQQNFNIQDLTGQAKSQVRICMQALARVTQSIGRTEQFMELRKLSSSCSFGTLMDMPYKKEDILKQECAREFQESANKVYSAYIGMINILKSLD